MTASKKTLFLTILLIAGCTVTPPETKIISNKTDAEVYSYDGKTFATKALTQTYVKTKLVSYMTGTVQSQKLTKELAYAGYRYPDIVKTICSDISYKISNKTIFE